MKIKLLLTTLFFILPFQLYADTIGVYLGAGVWNHNASGQIKDSGTLSFDLENDLHFKEEQEGYFYIAVEHPIPLIPNIRFASTKLSHAGSGLTTVTVTIGDQTFTAGDNLTTNLVFDTTDITFYYEILDNIVELDLGLTARQIDGNLKIVSSTITANETIDETIPMLYAAVGFNLPGTGLSFFAEGNFVGVSDLSYSDFTAKVRYEIIDVFGVEGGYRAQNLEIDDSPTVVADLKFSGVFAGVFVHF